MDKLRQGLQCCQCCQRAVLVDPDLLEGQLNLANLLLMKGDPVAAEIVCQKALELETGHPLALALQTIVYNNCLCRAKNWDKARYLSDLQAFVHIIPSDDPEGTALLNQRLAEMILAHPSLTWERTRNAGLSQRQSTGRP
ncbi:MAG: hypothetical protein ACUVRV_10800 [Cyanobacteriota bacterium]